MSFSFSYGEYYIFERVKGGIERLKMEYNSSEHTCLYLANLSAIAATSSQMDLPSQALSMYNIQAVFHYYSCCCVLLMDVKRGQKLKRTSCGG